MEVYAASPTTLPLRFESVGTCLYNGSTTQIVETSYGTNLLGLAFSGTTAYDFYSPPLASAMSLTAGDKGGGTITMRNTAASGANDFAVVAEMQFYDYDPATGAETLIVATGNSGNHNVNHGVTSTWAVPNPNLPGNVTVPAGHLLHAQLLITLNSGNPGGFGQVLYNDVTNSCTALLPQNRLKTWNFTSPTGPAITSQPTDQSVTNGLTATFSVTATGAGLTYQWECSTNSGSSWNNINAADGPDYTTPTTTAADNGNQYRVVVNGVCGPSLVSSAATLTVVSAATPPVSSAPTIVSLNIMPDHSALLQCAGNQDQVYLIQATTDLTSGNWLTISTNAIGSNGLDWFVDTDATNYPSRFYRTGISF
jgi:hypothetical protein